MWQRNHDLLRNAGSLLATTGVTSLSGFAYWVFAARVFSQESVGYGSAAISVMTLLGTIGMFGLGTMLIGELPQRRSKGGLVAAALIASAIGSLVLGIGFTLVALLFGKHFVEIDGTLVRGVVFCVGVALTGASMVFDEATIGLLRGGIQLARNTAFSVLKMAILPAAAFAVHSMFGVGITMSWILGIILSLVPVVILIRRSGSSVLRRPDWGGLRKLTKVTMAHNWLNLAIQVPPRLIPVLVTVVVSPSANAAYYVDAMIVSFLFTVPAHLSTVLFAIASATPEVIAEKLRFVLRLSLIVGITAMVALGASAHWVLGVFGPQYAQVATVPLWLLLLTYIPAVPKTQYIAVCRATGQVSKATVVLAAQSVAELLAVGIGGRLNGLVGLCFGLLLVGILEGLMTAPAVISAALGHLRLPTADGLATSAGAGSARVPETVPMRVLDSPDYRDYQRRQNAGLAALVAIATSIKPDTKAYDFITDSFPAIRDTGSFPAVRTPAQQASAPGGRHRRTGSFARLTGQLRVVADLTMTDMQAVPSDDADYRARQQAGLAALMLIARRQPSQF
jgi:O-antigen/teichoic acid export membrane protein